MAGIGNRVESRERLPVDLDTIVNQSPIGA